GERVNSRGRGLAEMSRPKTKKELLAVCGWGFGFCGICLLKPRAGELRLKFPTTHTPQSAILDGLVDGHPARRYTFHSNFTPGIHGYAILEINHTALLQSSVNRRPVPFRRRPKEGQG